MPGGSVPEGVEMDGARRADMEEGLPHEVLRRLVAEVVAAYGVGEEQVPLHGSLSQFPRRQFPAASCRA